MKRLLCWKNRVTNFQFVEFVTGKTTISILFIIFDRFAADMVYCLSAFDSHFGLSKASYTRNVGESAIGQK